MKVRFLNLDEILKTHEPQLSLFGGAIGILNQDLLASAVAMPSSGLKTTYFHLDIYEMAVAYLFHIIKIIPLLMEIKEQL
jgi:hypothetical protein